VVDMFMIPACSTGWNVHRNIAVQVTHCDHISAWVEVNINNDTLTRDILGNIVNLQDKKETNNMWQNFEFLVEARIWVIYLPMNAHVPGYIVDKDRVFIITGDG